MEFPGQQDFDGIQIGAEHGWNTPPHFHNEYELHVLLGGTARVFSDSTLTVLDGDVLLIPPRCPHSVICTDNGVQHIAFPFSLRRSPGRRSGAGISYEYYAEILDKLYGVTVFPADEMVRLCAQQLFFQNDHSHQKSTILTESLRTTLFLECMEILRERLIDSPAPTFVSASQSDERARRQLILDTYILNNFTHKASLTELARELHLSRSQCAQVVHQLTGMTLHQLILRQRMITASHLLNTTSFSLAEIASRVGYGSYSGFYTAYRAFYGIPPEQRRQKGNTGDGSTPVGLI